MRLPPERQGQRWLDEVWGHSVAALLRDAATYHEGLDALRPTGAALDKFYITTRYPNGLPDGVPADAYTEQEAADAIAKAGSILRAVAQHVGHAGSLARDGQAGVEGFFGRSMP